MAADYPVGRVARWVLGDFVQLVRALGRGRLRRAWAVAAGVRADIWDDFPLDDPGAFLGEVVSYAARALRPEA